MVFQIDNKDFDSSIFTRFSSNSKFVRLCNELYNRIEWDLMFTNDNDDKEFTFEYKQNIVEFIDTITLRVVIVQNRMYKRLPIIQFDNDEVVSGTNQLSNPTVTLFLNSIDKKEFVENFGMTIDFLNILWNTIYKKYHNIQWGEIQSFDPLSCDMTILIEIYKLFPHWSHAGITMLHFTDHEMLFQKIMKTQDEVYFLQRWFYTIDVINKDDNDFKNHFTKAFNVDISEFEKLRQRLIFMYLLYLRYYSFISKMFYKK